VRSRPKEPTLMPHPSVVSRRVHDEVVLVHLDTNRIYALNSTAARFWELVEEGCSRAEAEARLVETFEVEAAEVNHEVDECVKQLVDEGLVQITEPE
jgi:Coenzyme PQQ synthesis protein D (PqqD)